MFEIIQNAEDNNYSYATSAGKDPAIEFTLNSDTVQIDTNEDGFTGTTNFVTPFSCHKIANDN